MTFSQSSRVPELLRIGPRIAILPVVHGSGQFALTVRRWMLEESFDCVAVPLPPSFQQPVEEAVLDLPTPSIVIQPTMANFQPPGQSWESTSWSAESDQDNESDQDDDEVVPYSYVPVDPCQSVIMAVRAAMGERIHREYIDLETDRYRPYATVMPDPFAVRHVSPEKFAAAVLPSITRPPDQQTRDSMVHMAIRLTELEKKHQRILLVTSVLHWPWIREAYQHLHDSYSDSAAAIQRPEHEEVCQPTRYPVKPRTLMFLFGELPFITGLHERARAELEDDDDIQIDGVKELLLAARDSYKKELGNRARRVTPLHLSKCLQYIRNLSLIHRRMTPDLITIVTAAKQILGDQFALHVAELANQYQDASPTAAKTGGEALDMVPEVTLGIDQARLPDGEVVPLVSRLPGPPISWCTLRLQRRPDTSEKDRWKYQWNPYSQCSYPPEDDLIEDFRTRVFDRAQAIIGNDLAVTEKFTTSVKDGIDIRDTLRHWYEKQIYVKVVPPSRGMLDACVMLFDSPADPRDYPWRTTWFAEHQTESTLALFATHFQDQMVGPGIGMSVYGGAMFLYPPVVIPDVWQDSRLDYAETLEERLIAAACLHSRGREIALLSSLPPGPGWRRLARRHKKYLIHVPLSSFSDEQVQRLRMVHVLNGSEVRSYAEDFIRRI
ncbi:hypothetical protein K227x_00910 [Rubripirellula lacrimiformis]|uniref:Uncharacterized protein n=1 Tax=Rubripirellula lacrimiformis TaxID=1930273 RepID=A0A517N3L8_9BACT|nr:hypothetical protein [Rubripirellula lacrimiformis]QDT01724.1 hypothetical protein K227x_00910 [Rubripirellula lacrimiformis]